MRPLLFIVYPVHDSIKIHFCIIDPSHSENRPNTVGESLKTKTETLAYDIIRVTTLNKHSVPPDTAKGYS